MSLESPLSFALWISSTYHKTATNAWNWYHRWLWRNGTQISVWNIATKKTELPVQVFCCSWKFPLKQSKRSCFIYMFFLFIYMFCLSEPVQVYSSSAYAVTSGMALARWLGNTVFCLNFSSAGKEPIMASKAKKYAPGHSCLKGG